MAERLNRVGGDMPATNGSLAPVLGLPRALQCGEVMQLTSQVPQFSNEAVVQGKVSLFQWGHQVGARPTSCLSEAARPSADTRRQVPHLHLPSFLQVDYTSMNLGTLKDNGARTPRIVHNDRARMDPCGKVPGAPYLPGSETPPDAAFPGALMLQSGDASLLLVAAAEQANPALQSPHPPSPPAQYDAVEGTKPSPHPYTRMTSTGQRVGDLFPKQPHRKEHVEGSTPRGTHTRFATRVPGTLRASDIDGAACASDKHLGKFVRCTDPVQPVYRLSAPRPVPHDTPPFIRDGIAPPPPRTKWTRRVPHPVLIGHAASLSQALEAYVSKLFACAYSAASISVWSANPGDHLVHPPPSY